MSSRTVRIKRNEKEPESFTTSVRERNKATIQSYKHICVQRNSCPFPSWIGGFFWLSFSNAAEHRTPVFLGNVCMCWEAGRRFFFVSLEWVYEFMSLNNDGRLLGWCVCRCGIFFFEAPSLSSCHMASLGVKVWLELTRGNCLRHGTYIVFALDDYGSGVPFGELSSDSGRIVIGRMLSDPGDVLSANFSN